MAVLIREIDPSGWTATHVSGKHSLTLDDVEYAVNHRVRAMWHHHQRYGRRLHVLGPAPNGTRLRIWLYPLDEAEGRFRLGTAYPVTG